MSRTGARKPSSAGLTLVEVLMSVALLAGGAVLVMQAFARAWQAASVVDDRATAYRFALSKLADLELLQRQGREIPEEDAGSFRAGANKFQWSLTAQPDERDPEARHIVFSVAWPRGRFTDQATYELLLPPPVPPDDDA